MSSISTPNWLAVAGFVHLAFALGLALASLLRASVGGSMLQRTRAEAARRVDALTAAPFLIVAACCLVASHLVTSTLTPSLVVLILSAPMALLLYLGFEALWVEDLVGDVGAAPPPAKPMLRLPSPEPAMPHALMETAMASEARPNGSTPQ